jgi:hypothetical protein
MLPYLAGVVASCAILLVAAFILGVIVPWLPNKICRFVFLFVFCVPLNFIVNYVNVWAFGYHRMGRTGSLIIAMLLAVYGTFLPLQPHRSDAS